METRIQKPVQQQHIAVVVPFQEKQIPQIANYNYLLFLHNGSCLIFLILFETALLS